MGDVIRFPIERRGGAPRLVDKKELAAHLGFSPRWVDYRRAEGMPCKLYGSRVRFNIAEVQAWLNRRDDDGAA